MQCSPITPFVVDGRDFLVKRDDQIDPYLSGNKYRKLYTLLQTPKQRYNKIISYGGTQSNAMLALAALCHYKGWVFEYYTKPLSTTQLIEHQGNFAKALELGMQHKVIAHNNYQEYITQLRFHLDAATLVVDQGGASKDVMEGMKVFAKEIAVQKEMLDANGIRALALPSGTGTSALFLAKALSHYTVYTVACVGGSEYLKEQMLSLCEALPTNLVILEPENKYHFAKPYKEFYTMHTKLHHAGIEFDLLYAPLMWQELLRQVDEKVMYVHTGGVTGNATMLARYKQKGFAT